MKPKVWKTFLQPGWIFTFVIIIVFTYLAISVLAPWQLNKNTTVSHRNELIAKHFDSEPAPFGQVFGPGGELTPDNEYLRVRMSGHYLPDSEVVMRVRPVESGPAYHALTPFQLDTGEVVLVNRGWDRPDNGKLPADFPAAPTGEVTIVGYARVDEATPHIAPSSESGREMVTGIDTEEISKLTGQPLAKDYVQLASDQPGVLTAFPLPQLDNGPHLSYGIQWYAFGILVPVGLAYFVYAELRERRREAAEQAELATDEAPQRSRYGSAHQVKWQRDDEERY
ncbi:SURF1 family protein [Corynebacterium kalinowskii]|uniref:SURF1-like protein n=1 Tax=Corynebacterium kalinowskii TaxID=2675216 RepID=A0A6B8VBU9_9CORY|nr:SURF1 family protein [Corynebacterium kalinowskii]QGU01643.1 SURF1 family protein [Corynebacterium kalinowskii]